MALDLKRSRHQESIDRRGAPRRVVALAAAIEGEGEAGVEVAGGSIVFGDFEEEARVASRREQREGGGDEAVCVAGAAMGGGGGDGEEFAVAGGRLEEREGDERAGLLRAEGEDIFRGDERGDGGGAPRIRKAGGVELRGGISVGNRQEAEGRRQHEAGFVEGWQAIGRLAGLIARLPFC